MSTRASTSRVSLEDWDTLCPLTPAEAASVSRITAAASEKRLPSRLAAQQNVSRPATPTTGTAAARSHVNLLNLAHGSPTGSPRPQSAASMHRTFAGVGGSSGIVDAVSSSSLSMLDLSEPIETPQQFHDWFTRVERAMERQQEEIYRHHLHELDGHVATCEGVLEQLDDARGLLSEMEANYRFVEDNSRALQLACETMLDEQKHLIEVTEAIGARLEYFRELEKATRMLNLPGEDLVLQEDFLNLLDRLDVCLDYLKANRDFKDAELYILRFQQCLTRSMTLIKMYFVSTVRKLTAEVGDKMAGKDLSDTALHALLYAKFSSGAETLKILLFELEKRARIDPAEYGALLQECYGAWFASRGGLLSASLAEEVRRMEPNTSDLIKLARAGCNHLRAVCMSEWSLYKELFSSGETEVYHFLESLCDYLYDSMRPRILHEQRIEALCELCTVLGAMMALDSEAVDEDDDDEFAGDAATVAAETSVTTPGASSFSPTTKATLGRLRFSVLLQTIQQDAQTRLVFRAQAVIQSDVLHFVPGPNDIDYPERLEAHKNEGLSLWTEDERLREAEVGSGGFRVPREQAQKTWYATLKRTVWVLSKLNTYVNNAIFEDFAGEAVTLCRQSLMTAANQVGARSPTAKTDGQLFLIRHLLLLKEMIRSVDLVHVERAADFSTVTDALVNLLRNSSMLFNPNALYELASKGIPNFAETMTDAKMDLDSSLKRACEVFITDSSSRIASLIRTFLDRCTAYLSSPNGKDLPGQSWATPDAVIALHGEFQDSVAEQTVAVMDKLKLYLNDEKTIGVLLPPLLDDIVDTYTTFFNLTRSEYGFATSSSLSQPVDLRAKLEAAVRS